MFSQEHLRIALCQFLSLPVDFWIKTIYADILKIQIENNSAAC